MAAPDFNAFLDHYLEVAVAALGTPATDTTPAVPFGGKAFVQPGEEVAWDQCDCEGQAWSRLVRAQPVYGDRKANGKRCIVRWDVQLAIGSLRCVTGPTDRGTLPKAATITAEGHRYANDFAALLSAVECDPYTDTVLEAVALGPNGGCAGSEVRFNVRVGPCCD
jgi:hypothetical protein